MDFSKILDVKKEQIFDSAAIVKEFSVNKGKITVLSSGSKNIDKVLGGGFHAGKNYLIFGASVTGKTQLCHQICIQAFKCFSSDISENVFKFIVYLDTENTFRPERIRDMSIASDLNYQDVLKNILVAKIMSDTTLLFSLSEVEKKIKENNTHALIIDSINNYYRLELGNKNLSFFKTKALFLKILNKITELTKKFNLITIATAQIAPNFVENSVITDVPVGNQFLNHFFTEYLYLAKYEKNNYVQLVNSSLFPEKKLLYRIALEGIKDYKIPE